MSPRKFKRDPSSLRDFSGGALLSTPTTVYTVCFALTCMFFGFVLERPNLYLGGIAAFSILGLLAWLAALKRYRAIADTPTAALRSAAQGYVEISGICRAIPSVGLIHLDKAPPCVWYFATVKTKKGESGVAEYHYERSDEHFLIEDGTGECVIDPEHAEVLLARQDTWEDAHTVQTVRYLLPGERLYAIGAMSTLRPADGTRMDSTSPRALQRREWSEGRRRSRVSALLRWWKRDGSALAQQYDANGDGDIDSGEWQKAVTDAESEVDAQDGEMLRNPGLHMMRAPVDGRPFLLSSRHPDELRQRYNLWAWFYLIVFVAVSAWGLAELFPGSP